MYLNHLEGNDIRLDNFKQWTSRLGFNDYEINIAYNGLENWQADFANPRRILDKWAAYGDIDHILKRWDPEKAPNLHKWYRGTYACGESNRRMILDAYEKGYEHVLLFENDAIPTIGFSYHADAFVKQIQGMEWDIINFGLPATKFADTKIWEGNGLIRRWRGESITRFHAYAVHSRFYEEFLRAATHKWRYHLDVGMSQWCDKYDKVYLGVAPRFFIQMGGKSNIQQKKIPKGGHKEALFDDLLMQ